jgi:phosphoglycolate phosphatase-like HAD superfamily hydrolase
MQTKTAGELLNRPAAVFFDIDGTLVDSNEFHVVAWDEAFRRNRRAVPRHLLREQIGKGADILIPSLFPGVAKAEQKSLADAHSEIFKSRFLNLVRPFPHAADLIHRLHVLGKKVLLVSSSDQKEVDHYARLLAVESDLSGTVGFDEVRHSKPAGELFAVALGKAKVAAADAIAVGDTPYDVEAAAKCSVRTIALRSGGFSDEQLAAAGALVIAMDVETVFSEMKGSSSEGLD